MSSIYRLSKRIGPVGFSLALTVGCIPEPVEPPREVVIFGDSLVWDAIPETSVAYGDSGVHLTQHAHPGTQVYHWIDQMRQVPEGATVVVALGTNDLSFGTLETAKLDALAALAILESRKANIVWLTLSIYSAELRSIELADKTKLYNKWLRNAAEYGDFPLQIEGWDLTSYNCPEWYQEDNVHHTSAGQRAYARALLAASKEN